MILRFVEGGTLTLLADEVESARLDWRLGLETLSIATGHIWVLIESRP